MYWLTILEWMFPTLLLPTHESLLRRTIAMKCKFWWLHYGPYFITILVLFVGRMKIAHAITQTFLYRAKPRVLRFAIRALTNLERYSLFSMHNKSCWWLQPWCLDRHSQAHIHIDARTQRTRPLKAVEAKPSLPIQLHPLNTMKQEQRQITVVWRRCWVLESGAHSKRRDWWNDNLRAVMKRPHAAHERSYSIMRVHFVGLIALCKMHGG